MPSVEAGNAYRIEIEDWPARGQGLQRQVRLLYNALAERIEGTTAEELMDSQTLALNFCPFRSPSRWTKLANPRESIECSQRMWGSVLDIVEPSVIVCLGTPAMENLEIIFRARGAALTGRESHPVEWGRTASSPGRTYKVARYATTHGEVTMVGLPHMSQYKIFGRPESRRATAEIADTISAALRRAPTAT